MMDNRKGFSTIFFAMTVTLLICPNPAFGFFNQTTVQQPKLYKGWSYFFQHLIPAGFLSSTQFQAEKGNLNEEKVIKQSSSIVGPAGIQLQPAGPIGPTMSSGVLLNERVGGAGATTATSPWRFLVNLRKFPDPPNVFFCSGSLITDQIVLLAARCLETFSSSTILSVTLRIGQNNPTNPSVAQFTRTISQFIIHSGYNAVTHVNDIAVIKMNMPVIFSWSVGLVSLPAQSPDPHQYDDMEAVIMGWGPTTPGAASTALKQARVFMQNIIDCRSNPSLAQFITNSNICIITANTKFTCIADTGGPIVINTAPPTPGAAPVWTQVGINSYTQNCASDGLKTRVSAFRDWIDQQIQIFSG